MQALPNTQRMPHEMARYARSTLMRSLPHTIQYEKDDDGKEFAGLFVQRQWSQIFQWSNVYSAFASIDEKSEETLSQPHNHTLEAQITEIRQKGRDYFPSLRQSHKANFPLNFLSLYWHIALWTFICKCNVLAQND